MKLSKIYQHKGSVYGAVYDTGSFRGRYREVELIEGHIFKNKNEADQFVEKHRRNFNNLRTVRLNLADH